MRNELPGLLEDIPLMIQSQIYVQRDGAPPHYTRHVRDYLNESFPNRWLDRGGPLHGHQGHQILRLLIFTSGAT